MMIQDCDAMSRLVEWMLDVEVFDKRDPSLNYTDINFEIINLHQETHFEPMIGQISFDQPVNMTFLSEDDHFFDMFQIYWYRKDDAEILWDMYWLNVTVDRFDSENMTINFTVYGEEDTILKGTIVAEVKLDFDYTQIFVTNDQTTFLNNMKATKDFDYVQLTHYAQQYTESH